MASLALQHIFPIPIPLIIFLRFEQCHQISYFNATDLKLGRSTYFFLLFPLLVLHLKVGKSSGPMVAKGLQLYCLTEDPAGTLYRGKLLPFGEKTGSASSVGF